MNLFKYIIPVFVLFSLFILFSGTISASRVPKDQEHKISICHVPPGNPANAHVINIDKSAWENGHTPHNSHDMDFVVTSSSPDCPKKTSKTPTPNPTATLTPTPTTTTPGPTATPTPTPTSSNQNQSSSSTSSTSQVLGTTSPQLPKTGPGMASLVLAGLFPVGLKLRSLAKK